MYWVESRLELQKVVALIKKEVEEHWILSKLDVKVVELEIPAVGWIVPEDLKGQWFIDVTWEPESEKLVPSWSQNLIAMAFWTRIILDWPITSDSGSHLTWE